MDINAAPAGRSGFILLVGISLSQNVLQSTVLQTHEYDEVEAIFLRMHN